MNLLALDNPFAKPRTPILVFSIWVFSLSLLVFTFRSSLSEMVWVWTNVEEYSHGFFIPAITAFLLWLRQKELKFIGQFNESLPGIVIVLLGLLLFMLGGMATLEIIEQYAFIVTLTGMFTLAFGVRGLRLGAVPLLFLVFMVPFPSFIMNNLSSKLQLISSWLGVEFIRTCDIMVYLEGNVIDLGGYKLQVVDACSGLRYLFPLASLSFLCAYLFRGPLWQKALIFLSSMPLTIFMNSFRIAVIGVLVNYWGTNMAEGFLHDFEGWIIFLICMVLLFLEMWLFSRISGRKAGFSELVSIPEEWAGEANLPVHPPVLNNSIFLLLMFLCVSALAAQHFQGREDIIPTRKAFLGFPLLLGGWQGQNEYIGKYFLDELKLTDYVIINYTQPETGSNINFYSAYYQSQRKGVSVHSPKGCIPGDGWQIVQFGQKDIPDIKFDGNPLKVNRAVIEKGDSRQLVYYWFQQRGRTITNEYLVKWFLFYDAITLNRTDGSLVRLVTNVGTAEGLEVAERRLRSFIGDLVPVLPAYIPGKRVGEYAN